MYLKKAIQIFNELDSITRKTFHLELIRSFALGVIETAGSTFFLLYMVRVLSAGVWPKAFVAAGGSFGYLLAPLIVQFIAGTGFLLSRGVAFLFAVSGAACFFVMIVDDIYLKTLFLVIALAAWNTTPPLMTQIYADNYPRKSRGALFSINTMCRIIAAGFSAYFFGYMLDIDSSFFDFIIISYGLVFIFAAYLVLKFPSRPLVRSTSNALRDGFRAIKYDRIFRITLISWMFMGFGNLMLFPLRVEYLANPDYKLNLTEWEIALLVSVIPNISRFFCSIVWGMMFDRVNFFTLRVLMNAGFVVGMFSFFLTSSWFFLVFGAVVYGIAIAGGDVAWNLWVIKFAPEGKSQAYMAVHTFLTGVRGVLAPLLGFQIIATYGFQVLLIGSTLLVVIASLLLLFERRNVGEYRVS